MKNLFLIVVLLFCISGTYAQVGIKQNNTAPISSAQLEVQSTTKAFYPPRMTTTQRTTMPNSPLAGAVVYDTDLNGLFTYNGSDWVAASGLALPYLGSANIDLGGYVLDIANTTGSDGSAIVGRNSTVITGEGVLGIANAASPLSNSVAGVYGRSSSTNSLGVGVRAFHAGLGSAFLGSTVNGIGASLSSTNGFAIKTQGKLQFAGNGVGTLGVGKFLKSTSVNGDAQWSDLTPFSEVKNTFNAMIYVENTNTATPNAIASTIVGVTNSDNASGVLGYANNQNSTGVSTGITGLNYSFNSSGYGVFGRHYGSGSGVFGGCVNGNGIVGVSYYGVGGYFDGGLGYALVTTDGTVGLGTSTPALNTGERVDINGRLRIRSVIETGTSGVWMNNSTNSIVYTDGAFYGMKIDTETGIFIGGAWRFWVNNLGNATLTGTLTQLSDRRLKKDFSLLNNSLSDIYQLNGYHYQWIEESRSKDVQTGLIAQEVQKIFPELVQTDDKGFLSVNYIGLIPHLIESVKELRNENINLKNDNASMKSRLDKIEAILAASNPSTGK
jgi:Chaperone of endosialidase